MGIFDTILGNKEEKKYRLLLGEVYHPLVDRIDAFEEREVRDFFKTILDAAERSLYGILFMAPEEFNFKKQMTKEEIDFWLRKASLALMSYSYYSYANAPEVEVNRPFLNLLDISYRVYWQRMFDCYNQIFEENVGQKDIDYYASGLKEDTDKGYSSKLADMEKAKELTIKDYKTIASELLKKIWEEDISSNERKGLFLGVRIWQAHEQIIQPFLVKLLKEN